MAPNESLYSFHSDNCIQCYLLHKLSLIQYEEILECKPDSSLQIQYKLLSFNVTSESFPL